METAELLARAARFEAEAHALLGMHETSSSRVVLLENSYDNLKNLSILQDELFRQALRCVESGLFRAAHVMAWCGLVDYLADKFASDGFKKLRAARSKWLLNSKEDLLESQTDYALIEAARAVAICSKTEMKALHGLLSKRNECAHPSSYFPGLNESLGYVSELFQRIATLQKKPY